MLAMEMPPSINTTNNHLDMPSPSSPSDVRGESHEDNIKSAVREAARKAQERLAAYQKKQEAKVAFEAAAAAAKALNIPNKALSQNGSNGATVSRLQALVSESKRLTNKSRDATSSEEAALSASEQSAGERTSSSQTSTSRGKKLSALFQSLNQPTPTNAVTGSSNPNLSNNAHSKSNPSSNTAALPLPAFGRSKTSSAIPTRKYNQRAAAAATRDGAFESMAGSSLSSLPIIDLDDDGSGDDSNDKNDRKSRKKRGDAMSKSMREPRDRHSRKSKRDLMDDDSGTDSVRALLNTLKDSGIVTKGKLATLGASKHDKNGKGSSKHDKNKLGGMRDNSMDSSGGQSESSFGNDSSNDNHPIDNGGTSIFDVLDAKKKEQDKLSESFRGITGDEMDQEEIEALMDDYYKNPSKAPSSSLMDDEDLPPLEDIADSPENSKAKAKVSISSKKQKQKDIQDDDSDIIDNCNNDDEGDMPILAPFETPKVSRPKLTSKTLTKDQLPQAPDSKNQTPSQSRWTKSLADFNQSCNDAASAAKTSGSNTESPEANNQSPVTLEQSLNLSEVFRNTEIMSDHASSRIDHHQKPPARRHTKRNHRAGLEGVKEEDEGEGDASSRSSRQRGATRRSASRRALDSSEKSTGSEVGDGEDPSLDDHSRGDRIGRSEGSMEDKSDGTSASAVSRKGASRRGRGMSDKNRSRRARSQSVKGSRSSRSVSRSASMRRKRFPEGSAMDSKSEPNAAKYDEDGEPMKDTSRRARSSRRGDLVESSMKDKSQRRRSKSASKRRGPTRRNPKRMGSGSSGGAMDEESTADQVLESMDVSDIKLVDDTDDVKNHTRRRPSMSMDESKERTSIYDKKERRPSAKPRRASLSGLETLEPTEEAAAASQLEKEQSDGVSVAASALSKKSTSSRMSKIAKSVGRKLTGKKKKQAPDGTILEEEETENEEMNDESELVIEADKELLALAAEYDEEEKELGGVDGRKAMSQCGSMDDESNENDSPETVKIKKKKSVFGKIKKVGSKMTKKKKKSSKKDKKKKNDKKGAEVLDSDSDSDSDDDEEANGSEYSGLDRSGEDDEDQTEATEDFAQLKFHGGQASITMSASERIPDTPTSRIRQRRSSSVMARRQRQGLQQRQSLQAVLGKQNGLLGDDGDDASVQDSVQGSVTTPATRARSRRAQSARGRIARDGSRRISAVRRPDHGKEVGENEPDKSEKSKKMKRSKSLEAGLAAKLKAEMEDREPVREEAPSFDWKRYSEEQQSAISASTKKGGTKDKKKASSKAADNKMKGGLSKLIYHHEAVAN